MCLLLPELKPDLSKIFLVPPETGSSRRNSSDDIRSEHVLSLSLHLAAWKGDRHEAESLLQTGADSAARASALTELGLKYIAVSDHDPTSNPNREETCKSILLRPRASETRSSGFPVLLLPKEFLRLATFSSRLLYPELPYATQIRDLTPLHIAVLYGRSEITEGLLHAQAEVDAAAVILSISKILESNCPVVPAHITGFTPLHLAVANANREITEMLLTKGADPNFPIGGSRLTPLHLAVVSGDKDITDLLLKQGTLVDSRALYEKTPLHFAAESGDGEIAKILLAHGADPNAATKITGPVVFYDSERNSPRIRGPDSSGFTPLHLAVTGGRRDVTDLLLSRGADADAGTGKGKTCLHIAAESGHKPIVELLLSGKTTTVNARDKRGKTPLHYAAQEGRKEVVQLLIEHNALISERAKDGKTPLDLAVERKDTELVHFLARTGATRGKGFLSRMFKF